MSMKTLHNPKVDAFMSRQKHWLEEFKLLRTILCDFELTEELKWGQPCYVYEGNNIVIIQGFKEYFAIMFVKGALINDTQNVLIQMTENVQSARQIRFKTVEDIKKLEPTIRAYMEAAIDNQKKGLKVEKKPHAAYELPQELLDKYVEMPQLKEAFEALTPGRQRAYILHFSSAKHTNTRTSRINASLDKIFDGKGYNES